MNESTSCSLDSDVGFMKCFGMRTLSQFVKNGGDATMVILKGEDIEVKVFKGGSLPDPACTDSAESKCILQLLRDPIPAGAWLPSASISARRS